MRFSFFCEKEKIELEDLRTFFNPQAEKGEN